MSVTLSLPCPAPEVGVGAGRPPHPPSLQQPPGQVQKAAGAWEDPTHPVHGEPLHQGHL